MKHDLTKTSPDWLGDLADAIHAAEQGDTIVITDEFHRPAVEGALTSLGKQFHVRVEVRAQEEVTG